MQQSLPWTPSQALRPARWHATASSRYRARLAVARAVSFPSRRAEPLAPADAVSHPLRDTEGAFPVAKHPAKRVSSLAFTRGLRILFFVEAHNGMSQRLKLEAERMGHRVHVELALSADSMLHAYDVYAPDLVVCPILKRPVPEAIWEATATPVWIVHPGVAGDRGPHSIDWCVTRKDARWGVTVLEASAEMDAGHVWATEDFDVPPDATKSYIYRCLAVPAAARCLARALRALESGARPTPQHPGMPGTLRPSMDSRRDRSVDWAAPAIDVCRVVRASDSAPGARCVLGAPHAPDAEYFAYGAIVESAPPAGLLAAVRPGDLLAQRDGAVLVAAGDGTALWLSHLRRPKAPGDTARHIKLKATAVLPPAVAASLPTLPAPPLRVEPFGARPATWQEAWYGVSPGGAAVVRWEVQGGAFGPSQCAGIREAITAAVADPDTQVLVLAGSPQAFSNGIDLNGVMASADPPSAAWDAITSINDLVRDIFSVSRVPVVSALAGGAGAGGVMTALAADAVWAHGDVVLNPHYRTMGLTGSEYWTYFLPRKCGVAMASALTDAAQPILAPDAAAVRLVDAVLTPSLPGFMEEVVRRAEAMAAGPEGAVVVANKRAVRTPAWHASVEELREQELVAMRRCFSSAVFLEAADRFVHKHAADATPDHINSDLAARLRDLIARAKERASVAASHVRPVSVTLSSSVESDWETVPESDAIAGAFAAGAAVPGAMAGPFEAPQDA